MTSLLISKDLSKYSQEIIIEACPSELLKSVESLKIMGMTSTVFELSFKTIGELEIFLQILNREQDEERVANELKVTYFHNVRGKIKKTEMVKNEEFQSMKKVKFNSSYHVTLFIKYYQERIKQLENEYQYTITSGREGYLYVYLNDDENISSMFINEIRDMKKKLNFLEIKDVQLCERFIYSEKIGDQLKKIGVFHEIWYRGKQSTMIFYSEKQSLTKMKKLVHDVSRYHITIMKMADERFPFLINYFLFLMLKKSFWSEIRKLESVQQSQLEFNENKVGVVLHDMHEVFTTQIKEEILQKMKNFVLISIRAKSGRGYFNYLKKNYHFDQFLNFCYSKKTVCLCINLEKIKSLDVIRSIFGPIGESINYKSQITFHWLHLQDRSLYEYRKQLCERFLAILSSSEFYIENFQKLYLNKDLKCVIKIKTENLDTKVISQRLSKTLSNLIVAWQNKQIGAMNTENKEIIEKTQNQVYEFQQNNNNQEIAQQSDSDQSLYQQGEQIPQTQVINGSQPIQVPIHSGFQQNNNFTETLITYMKQHQAKYFESQNLEEEPLWKLGKSWRKVEEELLSETKIYTRIKKIQLITSLKDKYQKILEKLRIDHETVFLFFHDFESFDPNKYESPFYKPEVDGKITSFNDVKVGQKFVICCEMKENETIISYPLCSFEVMKRF